MQFLTTPILMAYIFNTDNKTCQTLKQIDFFISTKVIKIVSAYFS